MKTLFLSILSLVCSAVFSEKLGPDYQVTRSAREKTLSRSEAIFAFTFVDPTGKPAKTEIIFSYNKINKKEKPDAKGKVSLKVKPGKYVFQFFYSTACNEIYTDTIEIKPGYLTEMSVLFRKANEAMIVDKPVIYVYGKQNQKVSIKLDLKGEFSFTYPQYSNGWNFIANPYGSIQIEDKKYHYLFWDGKLEIDPSKLDLNEGFIIDKNNLVSFFEEKLKLMGLNSQEIEDYITYWCPRMNVNEKNYIHFIFNETYNNYATITIDPKPETIFRVCMLWSKADGNSVLKEQKIESFKRNGFTIVEWGGTEMFSKNNLN